jgi:hypothetical protein
MVLGGQRHVPAALPLGKTQDQLYKRLGEPQGWSGRLRKISPPPGFGPRIVQPVAGRYNDWAVTALILVSNGINSFEKCFSSEACSQSVNTCTYIYIYIYTIYIYIYVFIYLINSTAPQNYTSVSSFDSLAKSSSNFYNASSLAKIINQTLHVYVGQRSHSQYKYS